MSTTHLEPRAAGALPLADRVLVFSPHADDEVIGCGGALALQAEAGALVRVVQVFDGALGGDPAVRRAEAGEAVRHLVGAAGELDFWDLPEGHAPTDAELASGVERVRTAIADHQPDLILAPWIGEEHLDHRTVARAVRAAVIGGDRASNAWGFEVWTPLHPTRVVDIESVWGRKLAALEAHASQADARIEGTDLLAATERLGARRGRLLPGGSGFAEVFTPLAAGFPADPQEARVAGLVRAVASEITRECA